jgi:hypothetical protein
MDWEVQAQQVTALTLDQVRFAVSFLACIVAGILIRGLRSPTGGCARVAGRIACDIRTGFFEMSMAAAAHDAVSGKVMSPVRLYRLLSVHSAGYQNDLRECSP